MKPIQLSIFTLFILLTTQLNAWDEVTHAYMTRMIPDLVKDSRLKQLLKNNMDEYVYGCWYTDTYQYTEHRITALNPHIISTYGPAFMNYLQKEEVKKQENYDKLMALYLGSLSHLMEDFWYDSNLNKYQKTKNDKYKGDSKHGAFVAKQYGYLTLKVKRYFPKEDLFKMYKEAGMIQEEYDTLEKFEKVLNGWSNQQYLLLRSLKFINFLAGNQMHNESLWTAGNLKEIKGGMENCTEVAAKFIEMIWHKMNRKTVPYILHADYFEFDNKIAVLTSVPLDLRNIQAEKVFLLNNTNDTIRGKIKQIEHPDKKKGIAKYAFAFHPFKEPEKEMSYRLNIDIDKTSEIPFIYDFKTGSYAEKLADPKPVISTIGLGIFGFIPLVSIAILLFGIAGIVQFNWNYNNENCKLPFWLLSTTRILQFFAFITFFIGVYVLITRGEFIIDMAL
jgi:hypothetical protein